MKTVTLHCEIGNHDWQRASQRGVRPKSCPACKSAQAPEASVASAPAPAVDEILVALYADETGLSERVCRALLAADLEPPHRDKVDRVGFNIAQRDALDVIATKLPALEVPE